MLRTCTCIKGAVVVGLIATLTPALAGLWAQPLQSQQAAAPPGGTDAPGSLTEAQKTGTARRAMRGDKFSPGIRTVAPLSERVQGGPLMWFTDQAEFEAFNAGQGKVLKGIETFEASILLPNQVDGFDDPLEFGVPNLPDGFPYPNGTDGLPNLITQSNTLGNDPVDESPAGNNGLAAASVGFLGAVSDVVISNTFVNGLDLIFFEEKTAVGFNTLDFLGPQTGVIVRVYSFGDNVFLGEMLSPAEPTGLNFIGVFSDIPIGRINIFSGGAEGGDNIQAWRAGPGGVCGDANCDGVLNGGDIDPFFFALTDPAAWQAQFPDCNILDLDINGDGLFNNFDIDPFFIALGQGGCP